MSPLPQSAMQQALQHQQHLSRCTPSSAAAARTRASRYPCRPAAASKNGTGRTEGLTDPAIKLVGGAVAEGPDLSVTVNGLQLPNPFVIGSGPPGTNYAVMKKAFDEGWGGVICKTLSLDSSKV
jgi:dihydropyrimidine dehydrogenase (NADP+)